MDETREEQIKRLNELDEEKQRKTILKKIKELKWELFKGIDKNNFHFLTDNGIMVQKVVKKTIFSTTKYWTMVKKDTHERIIGDFGTIIYEFIKHYSETKTPIYL